ncbi:ATP-binding protein [Halovenus sp. HT40]|uniref:ATP-binding protein n=1 Tax=Halovenus sp. HT40 TaxID=3126691 RepID=UPI00300F6747
MITPVDVLFGTAIVAGVVLVGLGYLLSRRSEPLGVSPLAGFAVVLGLGAVVSGLLGLVGADPDPTTMPLWAQIGLFFWAVATVPWFLFALVYTGRYTTIRRRTIGLLYLPFVGLLGNFVWNIVGDGVSGVANAVSSMVLIYTLGLAFFGALLVVQAARSYVHLSTADGLGLAAAPILIVLALNSVGNLQQTATVLAPAVYVLALLVSTASFGAVVARSSVLDQTPAVETIGTRAIAEETDDLVFVVDTDDVVVKCNPRVTETLAIDRTSVLGAPLAEVVAYDSDDLRDRETVPLETAAGKRQYDPQVSAITDSDGAALGAVLSLRDVTDRQLREQRLTVLNRVLRHNLRNKIDVIKSHAEVLREDRPNQHVGPIIDTADEIRDLGYEARTIDRFLSESTTQRVDIVEVLEETRDTLAADESDCHVTVDAPDSATVVTNRQALEAAVSSAVDNALTYAASTVEIRIDADGDGYAVVVADDGSGIPEQELRSIDTGTETPLQHGTGLGLWQLKWAVTTMGGDLSFETSDGTTVRFTVPDVN